MIYFTADTHFDHRSIIEYCNRPFVNTNEMNKAILDNWNSVVTDKDEIYILGDFVFRARKTIYQDTLQFLNGRKIFITGNHDKEAYRINKFHNIFDDVKPYMELKYNKQKFCLFHYPIEEWNGKTHGSIHLHGHSHGKSREVKNRYDVGVDTNNFTPVSIEQVLTILNSKNENK